MSLLTNRKKNTDPPKKGEVYVTNDKVDFGVNARRNMTAEQDEKMAKAGLIPEVDAQGRRTGAYTSNRNKKPTEATITASKSVSEPKGRPSQPVMQADQNKKTGQKQVGSRYWDDEKKQWKQSK